MKKTSTAPQVNSTDEAKQNGWVTVFVVLMFIGVCVMGHYAEAHRHQKISHNQETQEATR